MAPRPAALLWDVDGTLAETEDQGHRPAFNAAFRDAGLPWQWDSELYHRLLAVSGGRERLARFLRDREGRTPDAALLDELVERKQSHYLRLVRQGCCALRPGVSHLLQEAAAAGLPQAIVTTSSRRAVKALAEGVLGQELGPVFAFWICGEDVAVKKPDPSAYTLAVERLGLPAATLLAIEDSPQGLAAASAAGVGCLISLSSLSRSEPTRRFEAALAVVENLSGGEGPVMVRRGPACPGNRVTLRYLQRLSSPA